METTKRAGTVSKGKRKGKPLRPLAEVAAKAIDPAVRRRGFAQGDIIRRWQEIIGADIAAFCQPEKMIWPRRDGQQAPATLVLRVEPAFGLEIQHLAPQLIERVNVYFGYGAVGKLRIVQAPLPPLHETAATLAVCPPDEADRIETVVEPVTDERLKSALARLGKAAAARATSER